MKKLDKINKYYSITELKWHYQLLLLKIKETTNFQIFEKEYCNNKENKNNAVCKKERNNIVYLRPGLKETKKNILVKDMNKLIININNLIDIKNKNKKNSKN